MKKLQLYYHLKPLIPRNIQIKLRRILAKGKRARYANLWPIDEKAADAPEGWAGWPDGKKFALVLTHDVETAKGHENCRELMQLEEKLGFRSSFGFVPERYTVSPELRKDLQRRGFEVSVHGLLHDGLYYRSKEVFRSRAGRINQYLKDWGAVGFRSPSMLHNLDWLHELDVEYDASTFDTDPFEPQPDGVRTIFPFWVGKDGEDGGYVELPYTLPQDHTLFVIMKEKGIDFWRKKLDWIAKKGGMALVITHPDYMHFGRGKKAEGEYPAQFHEEFLAYISTRYEGQYWHVLPRDMARFWARQIIAGGKQKSRREDTRIELRGRQPEGSKSVSKQKDSMAGVRNVPTRKQVRRACLVYYARFNGSAILYREAKALKERGFEVDLICLRDKPKDKMVQIFDGLRVYGIQARPEREKNPIVYFIHLAAFCIKCTLLLSMLSLAKRYRLIHVTTPPDGLVFASFLPKLLGGKVIMDVHDIGPEMYMRKLNASGNSLVVRVLKVMEKISAKFSDHIITVTDIWKEKIAKRSAAPSKCTSILNVPDEGIFRMLSPRHREAREAIHIYYHGSLEEHFGVDTLVMAMPIIKEAVPVAILHIYGAGRLKEELQALARREGIDGHVLFHGIVPFYDLPTILRDADIGVVPTKDSIFSDEALSMKSLEYISLGIPIVISRTKVHNMYYDASMVAFFTPGDEKDLAASVIELCGNTEKRKQLTVKAQRFMETYGWIKSKRIYMDIVDRLTG